MYTATLKICSKLINRFYFASYEEAIAFKHEQELNADYQVEIKRD